MFGLIVGMGVFSMLSLQWAKQEMIRQQERNVKREHAQATDVAKAMEFALLTETHGSYREDLDLQRAMAYTDTATAKTRGGEDVLVSVREDNDKGSFGVGRQRAAITASDDILKRSQVYRVGGMDDINDLVGQSNTTVVSFDTDAVRSKQIKDSVNGLGGMIEQVYAFFAGNMRFPSGSEYDQLADKFNYHDAWGKQFDYAFVDNENATMSFTTPWNYTYNQKLSLKDEYGEQ